MGVLETAMKIANQDADAEDEEEDGPAEAAKVKQNIKTLPNGQIVIVQPGNLNCPWTKHSNALLCAMLLGRLFNQYFLSIPRCSFSFLHYLCHRK